MGLRVFNFIISSVKQLIFFVKKLILSNLNINANIMKTHIYEKIKFDLKCYGRSHKVFYVPEKNS